MKMEKMFTLSYTSPRRPFVEDAISDCLTDYKLAAFKQWLAAL